MAVTRSDHRRDIDADLMFHFAPPPAPRRSAPARQPRRPANHPLRIFTVVAALACGGSLAYAIDAGASSDAQARRQTRIEQQLVQMQAAIAQTAAHDQALVAENARLVKRYNALVKTTRAQLHAASVRKAQAAQLALQLASARVATVVPPVSRAAIAVASSPAPVSQTS
jgi:hypothetical protein